jgi:serine/threonine protein kinase
MPSQKVPSHLNPTALKKSASSKSTENKGKSQVEILDYLDSKDQAKLDEIKEQERQYRNKVMNELRVLKILDHPNIVKLYEYFEDGGRPS